VGQRVGDAFLRRLHQGRGQPIGLEPADVRPLVVGHPRIASADRTAYEREVEVLRAVAIVVLDRFRV